MRNLLIAFVIGALLGAAGAFKVATADTQRARAKVLGAALQGTKEAVIDAQRESAVLQAKVDHVTLDTMIIKGEVSRYVPTRHPAAASADTRHGTSRSVSAVGAVSVSGPGLRLEGRMEAPEVHLAYGDDRLLAGAVCLLDAARAGEDAHRAAGRCDEAGDAPSSVDVGQLIQADLDAVAAYNQLAEIHNSLVTFVEDLQRKAQE